MEPKLKYLGYTITCQEVPDEVSLVINISGCPHRCEGCHSDYLWKYEGNYLLNDLQGILKAYAPYITCVCFMGGDQNWKEIQDAIDRVHSAGLKACVYSGRKNTLIARDFLENLGLDYYKIGEYDKKLGGLSCATTNQRFFSRTGLDYEDITHVFWRTHNAH